MQQGMPFGDAAQHFSLLTVGDGLAAQIPALLISVATGIIVTRSASEKDLGNDIAGQIIDQRKAPMVAGAAICMMALVPGLPKMPFLIVGGTFLLVARADQGPPDARRGRGHAAGRAEQCPRSCPRPATPPSARWRSTRSSWRSASASCRWSTTPPAARCWLASASSAARSRPSWAWSSRPSASTTTSRSDSHEYVVKVRGSEVARGRLLPGHQLAMDPGRRGRRAARRADRRARLRPARGVDRRRPSAEAEALGYTVVDGESVIVTHLTETIRQHAAELLTRQETRMLLDRLKEHNAAVVEEVVPDVLSVGEIQRVLQALLREGVSIRDLGSIVEAMGDKARLTRDPGLLAEYARQALGRAISAPHLDAERRLRAITLDPQSSRRSPSRSPRRPTASTSRWSRPAPRRWSARSPASRTPRRPGPPPGADLLGARAPPPAPAVRADPAAAARLFLQRDRARHPGRDDWSGRSMSTVRVRARQHRRPTTLSPSAAATSTSCCPRSVRSSAPTRSSSASARGSTAASAASSRSAASRSSRAPAPGVDTYDARGPRREPAPGPSRPRRLRRAIAEIMRVASPFIEQLARRRGPAAPVAEPEAEGSRAGRPEPPVTGAFGTTASRSAPARRRGGRPTPSRPSSETSRRPPEPARARRQSRLRARRRAPCRAARPARPAPAAPPPPRTRSPSSTAGIAPRSRPRSSPRRSPTCCPSATPHAQARLRQALARQIPVAAPIARGGAAIAFVGAGGSGKTLCAARLAAAYAALRPGRRVTRLAPPSVIAACACSGGRRREPRGRSPRPRALSVIDTPAVSPGSPADVKRSPPSCAAWARSRSTSPCPPRSRRRGAHAARRARAARSRRAIVLTHLDEVDHAGPVINEAIARAIAISYTSDGSAAEGFGPADPAALAAGVLA